MLRTEAGRNPHDRQLHELVGELSTRSHEFRRRWSAHDVRIHTSGTKLFHHSVVGDLTLAYETFDLAAEPGVAMTVYTAEVGSPTHEALQLLASWAATQPAGRGTRQERQSGEPVAPAAPNPTAPTASDSAEGSTSNP